MLKLRGFQLIVAMFVVQMGATFVVIALGCTPSKSAADRYRETQRACIDHYSTRAEIDACRAGAAATFTVTNADAGGTTP